MTVLLSTAYAPPIQYFCKLFCSPGDAVIEACESFVKQTYRNRCVILGTQGVETLTLPIAQGAGHHSLIREVRLSDHLDWRRQHREALRTAYGMTPFFEYYWDDIEALYRRRVTYLWDWNWELLHLLTEQLGLSCRLRASQSFCPLTDGEGAVADWRYRIRPKAPVEDGSFAPVEYYQPYSHRLGFVSNLSVLDLLFNMGPESILVIRDSIVQDNA